MNQPTKEEPGNIKELSREDSRASLFGKTVCYVATRPVNLFFYGVTWFHLYSLCQFGRLHKNVPILLLCLVWWMGNIGYGIYLWLCYDRRKSQAALREMKADEVKWYIKRKDHCQLFLKNKSVITVNLQEFDREEKDFLDLKLSAVNVSGKRKYRLAAGIFLAAVTVCGSIFVIRSAMPYHGKLSWYLDDLRDKRSITLVHDNIYESGVEGILEDIRGKVDIPKTLCLATSFNLHFAPDGTIRTFDTMLYGFDENGEFTDSYLITYNAAHSKKIDIYLHGADGAVFDDDKDLQPLIEAVAVMPLEETVAQWSGEKSFGILYYGTREWYSSEGIRYLNHKGEYRMPSEEEYYFSGYSISVFCPENEALVPVRYLYMGYQDFPEEETAYTADYYPEEAEGETEHKLPHATDNIWRTCTDYPLEQYGEMQEWEGDYTDQNGEIIYEYSYKNFHMKEDLPDAQVINDFLEEKMNKTVEAWQIKGEELAENKTAEDYDYWGCTPYDQLSFESLTYLEGEYCSLVFLRKHFSGESYVTSSLCIYTIDKNTGNEVSLQEIAPLITKEKWIDLIDQAFEKEQGFRTFFPGTGSEQTAGEYWYNSYQWEEEEAGFYLTKKGIAFYYGFNHIPWEGEGLIELVIPWEEIYPHDVHATDNIWRNCTDYPLDQYGEVSETGEGYTDENGEVIYEYSYKGFTVKDNLSGAQMINAFLEAKQAETIEEWRIFGEELTQDHTVAQDYYLGNHPTDSLTFECLTYLEGSYCSLVFFGQNYTGGVGVFPYLCTYTVNKNTGNEVTLQEIASHITEEEWIGLIDQAFEKEQGFRTFYQGTEAEQTAGEIWYHSYQDAAWGDGFYLTKEGIAFYYGFSHIAWDGEGSIEVVVSWEDINAQ